MARNRYLVPLTVLALLCLAIASARAQGPADTSIGAQAALGTAFTYQGYLTAGEQPAEGSYDLKFGLWDAPENGRLLGEEIEVTGDVRAGYFAVSVDFRDARFFNGEERFGVFRRHPK